MGKLKWYKRDPDAALAGMMELTLEERGAYNTVLDLIYARDGAVMDDDRFLAGWMKVDPRVWRRIRARLIALGKLYTAGGMLRNSRADEEVDRGLSRVASAKDAGRMSARSCPPKTSNNNDLASTVVERPPQLSTTTSTTTPKPESEKERERGRARAKPISEPEGTKLPPGWALGTDEAAAAAALGLTEAETASEARKFRDRHVARGTVRADWAAEWSMWCQRALERMQRPAPRAQAPPANTGQVYLKNATPEWEAWQRHLRATRGKGTPQDAQGGWWFEARWPPQDEQRVA